MNTSELITEIMRREGWDKYTNRPADRGGPTKWGITQAALADYRGKPVTAEDVQALDEREARDIYIQNYVRKPGFGRIRDGRLMALAVDCGVNHGPARAVRWLQQIVRVIPDGQLGPITAAAIERADPEETYYRLLGKRLRFYGQIVTEDWKRALEKARKTPGLEDDLALSELQAMFAHGWLNRAAEFVEA